MALMHHTVASGDHAAIHELWDTLEEYKEDPSMKLNALVRICKYHLAGDDAPPLKVDPEAKDALIENIDPPKSTSSDSNPAPTAPVTAPTPDKIVVYAAFPSQNMYIQRVLELYGIKSLLFSGIQSVTERAASLEKFKRSKRKGPRVLIVSNVGLYGLNVACANIMVVVVSHSAVCDSPAGTEPLFTYFVAQDTLWSAQEDRQLIGHVWRFPQQKQVHVYRIVAEGTSDVFLNNISFSKGAMHDAFMQSSDATRKFTDLTVLPFF